MASQEINSHKAGRQKRQKTSGGDDLGTRGNVQSAKRERGAGAVADILLAAAAGQGSQPGVSAANQERKDRMHDIKHEQGRPPEAEQDKLRKKRNRNKFKQTDEGGDAADLYKLHLQQQSPLDKSKQGLQYLHEQEQQAKPEQDALNKKRNRNISRQRDEAGQAAAYQSSQARSSVQQALQQPSSSAKVPEVPELDHRLSSKKQAAQKKQSIWEADAQGNEMGVNIGKGARKQNGQHTAGKQTATPNSLKGALLAGKHAVTQDGQLGRRHAATGSLHAAGPSRPKQDSLLSKMRAKLSGSQFRWLNEQLYTCPGSQAFELMQEQPQLFTQYHEASPCLQSAQSLVIFFGTISCACSTVLTLYRAMSSFKPFKSPAAMPPKAKALSITSRPICAQLDLQRAVHLHATRQPTGAPRLQGFKQQTAKWPLQPIQAAASYLHRQSKAAVVADFGCGDADLVRMVPQQTVHSLDLVSSAPGVIACNMAHTPLGKHTGLLMQSFLTHALLPVSSNAQVEGHASACHAISQHRCGRAWDNIALHLRQILHARPQETALMGSALQALDRWMLRCSAWH